ncbi:MAG: ABC transporter ATP-binding protein [Rhizonema sp. PD38]|nr:ABC transporter ATP-binding protein [Rhizonema sp. PD38]
MSDTVIRVENLAKKYVLAHQEQGRSRYKTFSGAITNAAKSLTSVLNNPQANPSREEFWALKDVSFEIKQGDRVGIIGRNGAGKSTLLKVLSRITEPTSGAIRIKGRVASLLEVGTGFHPELTGRENIFLNGAILGMRRVEIQRKFNEIVEFAEVEKFLDTPVKRYSSGMYVRLAFAVAAHLEPEILVVDEVLAVGDAQFQKKCLGKMEDVGKEGRTVLFVSHQMSAIRQLCSTSILLERGMVKAIDKPDNLINQYVNSGSTDSAFINLQNFQSREGNKKITFEWAKICNIHTEIQSEFSIGDEIKFQFKITHKNIFSNIKLAVEIRTSDSISLCNMIDIDSGFDSGAIENFGIYNVLLKDIRFYPDTYYLSFWLGSKENETYDYVKDCLSFRITDGGKLTMRPLPRSAGLFFLTPEWQVEY